MNDLPVRIRPAVLDDLDVVVSLIRLSMGGELDWLFGQEKDYPTESVMGALFLRKGNRLSHEICWVTEELGKVVGALVAFPGRMMRRLDVQTALHLVSIFGFAATMRLVQRQPLYGDLVEAEANEFYLSNLAVYPDCQGRGIGSAMLNYADKLAQAGGLKKCSLLVTFGNPARRLYERAGYRLVQTYAFSHPMIADGSGGFYRMVKDLNASS
jgi:ribosomal protein S18 acetylase RimI-like enzyme